MTRVKIWAQSDYSYLSEATVAIFKTMEKYEFRVLIKHFFLTGKILFKQTMTL